MNFFSNPFWQNVLQILRDPIFAVGLTIFCTIIASSRVQRFVRSLFFLGAIAAFIWLIFNNQALAFSILGFVINVLGNIIHILFNLVVLLLVILFIVALIIGVTWCLKNRSTIASHLGMRNRFTDETTEAQIMRKHGHTETQRNSSARLAQQFDDEATLRQPNIEDDEKVDSGDFSDYFEALFGHPAPKKERGILSPDDVSHWYDRGCSLDASGRYKEALDAFETVLTVDPDNVKAWVRKGFVLYTLYRYDEALAAIDRALELDLSNEDIWNELYQSVRSGRIEDAQMVREIAFRFETLANDPQAHAKVHFDADRTALQLHQRADQLEMLLMSTRNSSDDNLIAGG